MGANEKGEVNFSEAALRHVWLLYLIKSSFVRAGSGGRGR